MKKYWKRKDIIYLSSKFGFENIKLIKMLGRPCHTSKRSPGQVAIPSAIAETSHKKGDMAYISKRDHSIKTQKHKMGFKRNQSRGIRNVETFLRRKQESKDRRKYNRRENRKN